MRAGCQTCSHLKAGQHSVVVLCHEDTLLACGQLVVHHTPKVVLAKLLSRCFISSMYWCLGLFLCRCATLYPALLRFIRFLSVQVLLKGSTFLLNSTDWYHLVHQTLPPVLYCMQPSWERTKFCYPVYYWRSRLYWLQGKPMGYVTSDIPPADLAPLAITLWDWQPHHYPTASLPNPYLVNLPTDVTGDCVQSLTKVKVKQYPLLKQNPLNWSSSTRW